MTMTPFRFRGELSLDDLPFEDVIVRVDLVRLTDAFRPRVTDRRAAQLAHAIENRTALMLILKCGRRMTLTRYQERHMRQLFGVESSQWVGRKVRISVATSERGDRYRVIADARLEERRRLDSKALDEWSLVTTAKWD
jgi:hypothetical protein